MKTSKMIITGAFITHKAREIYKEYRNKKSFEESVDFLNNAIILDVTEEEKMELYTDIILGVRDVIDGENESIKIVESKANKEGLNNSIMNRLDRIIFKKGFLLGSGIDMYFFRFLTDEMMELLEEWVDKYNDESINLAHIITKDSKLSYDLDWDHKHDRVIEVPYYKLDLGHDYSDSEFELKCYFTTYKNTKLGDIKVFQPSLDIVKDWDVVDTVTLFRGVMK